MKDGDSFGELMLSRMDASKDDLPTNRPKRAFTATTTELTDVLVISLALCQKLQIEEAAKENAAKCTHPVELNKQGAAHDKPGSKNYKTEADIFEDYLKFHVPQFQNVHHANFFKNLSQKINKKKFKYGEEILARGQVPEGLHILVYGECKTILKVEGKRSLLEHRSRHKVSYNRPCNGQNGRKAAAQGATRQLLPGHRSVARREEDGFKDLEDAEPEEERLSRKQIEDQLQEDEFARKQQDAHLRSQVKLQKFNHENADNFRFSPQDPLLEDLNPDNSPLKQITFNNKYYGNNRIVIDDQGNRIPDNRLVHEHQIEFGRLKSGSTFGGRMLVPFKFFHARMQSYFGNWAVERKFSRFTNSERELESTKDSETL